jgi:long-subunit fatty acid transport protein
MTARAARANPEPSAHDARSLGMGGVGTSFIGDGAAAFHNPAGLDQVERFTISGSFTPILVTTTAPWAGPGTETDSEPVIGPLFEFGGGIRVTPWFVVGFGGYIASGFGSEYEDVPALDGQDTDVAAAAAEVTLPLVFRLMEGLSIGVAPRLAFVRLDSSTLAPMMAPGEAPILVRSEVKLSGVSLLGVQIGARYQPLPFLRVGFNYRSAMNVEISGTTRVLGDTFDTESDYATPHSFRFGVDVTLLDGRLLVAADGRYMLYSLSHEELTTTLFLAGVETSTTQPLHWKDSFSVMTGAEYAVVPLVPVRIGFLVTPSATPEETANPFSPIPGTTFSVGAGAGLRPAHYDIDFAVLYSITSTDIDSGPTAGSYDTRAYLLSLSVSYHR